MKSELDPGPDEILAVTFGDEGSFPIRAAISCPLFFDGVSCVSASGGSACGYFMGRRYVKGAGRFHYVTCDTGDE